MKIRSRSAWTLPSTVLLLLVVAASGTGCGSSAAPSQAPPAVGPMGLSTGALQEGAIWQLNRPIDITLDRPIHFLSVTSSSVSIRAAQNGVHAMGTFVRGLDPATGATDLHTVRFQPACPVDPAGAPGLLPATDYVLTIRGTDTSSYPLRAQDGTLLESTTEIAFTTPSGTDPATLFHDSRLGPPRVVFRGRPGVHLEDPESTLIELGRFEPASVLLRQNQFGLLEVDPASEDLVPFGLPLNHHVAPSHQVAIVVRFDQPVSLARRNLERIGLEYHDGSWKPITTQVEAIAACGARGSSVKVRPVGTLPPGRFLRLVLKAGFQDLVGQAHASDVFEYLPLTGTTEESAIGARVDAIIEHFTFGGDEPGSMEDTESDLGAPRGHWGRHIIGGIETPDGLSRVRSKWYPVGLAGADGSAVPQAPRFSFFGTAPDGAIRTINGEVLLEEPVLGPITPAGYQPFALEVARLDLVEPTGLRAALPALLTGDRARSTPDPATGSWLESQIFGVSLQGDIAALGMGYGCYAPGIALDCVPWDLTNLASATPARTIEIHPQSFEVYTLVDRDRIYFDHRITITFDAARAAADGQPDLSTAYSASNGWTPDVNELSGAAWDFLRFEVQFELDVSGDGYQPFERAPAIDFIKIPVDFRP
ncbi:hypothetical protein Poly30_55880 [Planctomycetes bacterium Poly30]|uniref:SbsA Ig-like domain-containing protein n=1 Tax=Saltatorellus ferox TaxID=2528018 RepID=A0A518F116_9BACT|nr:hypothetical protein Poly30_55880 [Planctomycetes bacterium Poly30]